MSLYDGSLSAPFRDFLILPLYHEADVAVPQTENGAGGSCYYQDLLQDAYMSLINCAYAGTVGGWRIPEEHAEKSVARLTGKTKPQDLSVEKNSGYSEALGCPVYILDLYNRKKRRYKCLESLYDGGGWYTYLYAFSVWADAYADREDTIDEVFGQLCFPGKVAKGCYAHGRKDKEEDMRSSKFAVAMLFLLLLLLVSCGEKRLKVPHMRRFCPKMFRDRTGKCGRSGKSRRYEKCRRYGRSRRCRKYGRSVDEYLSWQANRYTIKQRGSDHGGTLPRGRLDHRIIFAGRRSCPEGHRGVESPDI